MGFDSNVPPARTIDRQPPFCGGNGEEAGKAARTSRAGKTEEGRKINLSPFSAWERWEADYLANEPADFQRNQAIFWALWAEAVQLGVFPGEDLLEGLDVDIRVAKALNSV